MKRVLWLGIGLAVGALVVRAASKKMHALSPSGLAAAARDSAGGVVESVRSFVADVREGMAEREHEIHAAFAGGIALDDELSLDDDLSLDDHLSLHDAEIEEGKPRR